ncbi:pentapeptide repeat-containing protein [Planococcus shenhongbingii]|uniref:Pentapeptide repeat-containing protein n=1 Tax=Planococcus shenhongbingii TaxID=3058398 RepID=A0ABT8NDT5_9BACL|nr:pentapeptide repeat-containing protein [Planococcus sp. N017]MDN7246006.1 pentapeptide repeat-containing protein [Planococcus sp. N017]
MMENRDGAKRNLELVQKNLKADCGNCFALCCAGLCFTASADFAFDKAAGVPCPNLQSDFRCGIHEDLRRSGFKGCTVFDCYGSGQKVSQVTFKGKDWRKDPGAAKEMFAVFPVMTQLHEMLWYLADAMKQETAKQIYNELEEMMQKTERLTLLEVPELMALDIPIHRAQVNDLLVKASELARADVLKRNKGRKSKKLTQRNADMMGAELKGADLKGVDFRGAYFIAANLRQADLRTADLIGADFRDADISGADLSTSLFLTQVQANAAIGDCHTKLPEAISRPDHWAKKPRIF